MSGIVKAMPKNPYGLSPRSLPRHKRWMVEIDYYHKLSPAERSWLAQFNREFHEGKVRKGDAEAFHAKDALRLDCYRRNNSVNRDLYAIKQCTSRLYLETEDGTSVDSHEVASSARVDAHRPADPLFLFFLVMLELENGGPLELLLA